MKIYSNEPGHMTKMVSLPIYGKNTSEIFFCSIPRAYDPETLYVASETGPSLHVQMMTLGLP